MRTTLRVVIGCLLLIGTPAWSQAPSISTIAPQAIAPGQTLDVAVAGGNLAGATELWTTFSSRAALAPDVPNNGQDAARVVFRVTAPQDAVPGLNALRVTAPGGVSSLKLFVIDDLPTVAEAGNNGTLQTAQAVPLSCGVDGRVDSLARDFYKFDVQAGQRLSFEVLARRLGSPLDPSLFLYRADGRELAYNDDAEGLSSDSQLCYTFKEAGAYVVEVRDIRYQGGGNHVYRLRIGDFPCVNVAVPSVVRRGVATRVDFAGTSVDDAAPALVNVPADFAGVWVNVSTKRPNGSSSAFASVQVTSAEEFLEREPNDTAQQANQVSLGTQLNGRFEKPGDVDRFTFPAKQGQRFVFSGVTRQIGAPTDLTMRLFDAGGNQVAMADDAGTEEGNVNYTFPADGQFTLAVQDLHRRGGGQYAYRVAVEEYRPGFTLSAAADALNVPAGGVTSITVNVARRDYGGAIDVAATGLPPGLTSLPTRIGPGMNTVVLTVHGAKDAQPATLTTVQITGSARIGESDFKTTASVTGALRGQWSNTTLVPGAVQESVALAVAPAAKLVLRTEPAEIVFGKELRATVKVIAERGEGIDEQIQLAVTPQQNGLPGNVAAELKPIEKGQNEIEIAFNGNANAPLGPFTAVLVATHKKGNDTVTATTPGIGLRLEPPLGITASVPEPKLARGGQLKFKVAVQRNPAFTGEVKLTLDKLPAGVTAAEVVVPADQKEAEVTLAAAADAAQGAASGIVVNAVAPANAKFTASTPLPAINVE
jgi:hypothetical protein